VSQSRSLGPQRPTTVRVCTFLTSRAGPSATRAVLRASFFRHHSGEFVACSAVLAQLGHDHVPPPALAGLDPRGHRRDLFVPIASRDRVSRTRCLPWQVLREKKHGCSVLGRVTPERGERARPRRRPRRPHHANYWPRSPSQEAMPSAPASAPRARSSRDPRSCLLDEPFVALDALTAIRIHRLVTELCRASHPDPRSCCPAHRRRRSDRASPNRVLVLNRGRDPALENRSMDPRSLVLAALRPRFRGPAQRSARRLGVGSDADLDRPPRPSPSRQPRLNQPGDPPMTATTPFLHCLSALDVPPRLTRRSPSSAHVRSPRPRPIRSLKRRRGRRRPAPLAQYKEVVFFPRPAPRPRRSTSRSLAARRARRGPPGEPPRNRRAPRVFDIDYNSVLRARRALRDVAARSTGLSAPPTSLREASAGQVRSCARVVVPDAVGDTLLRENTAAAFEEA